MFVRLLRRHISSTSSMGITSFVVLLKMLILIEPGFVRCSESSQCGVETMAVCQAPFGQLLNNQDYVIAVNKTQLFEVCDKLKMALECVDDFLGRCLDADREEMDKFFSGFRMFLYNVCQEDSEFSKEYLRHAPCMAEADDQIRSCMNDSRFRLVNPMSDSLSSTSTTDIVDTVCCVMKHFLTCSEDVYGSQCGAEASRLGHQTLLTMLGPTIQNACMDDYGNFKCSAAQHHQAATYTPLLSLITFLVFYKITVTES